MLKLIALVLFMMAQTEGEDYIHTENVAGAFSDNQLFRVVCHLNTSDNPQYVIKITGRSITNTAVFTVTFMKTSASDSYTLSVSAGLFRDLKTIPHYEKIIKDWLIDEEGIPLVPLAMAYLHGLFTCHTGGEGLVINSTTQARDVETVSVMASGINLVDCTCVETGTEHFD